MGSLSLFAASSPIPAGVSCRRRPDLLPARSWGGGGGICVEQRAMSVVSLWGRSNGGSRSISGSVLEKLEMQDVVNVLSTRTGQEIMASGSSLVSSSSQIGSPLFWIGVGVGISAAFSMMATRLKRIAILKAFKSVMDSPQNGGFNTAAFSQGTPFPFATESSTPPAVSSPTSAASKPVVPVNVPKTGVQTTAPNDITAETKIDKEAT